jgi:hypothetical protein
MELAPIVLFVYNRPEHTKRAIRALQKNEFAAESRLFIYSDGSKNTLDIAEVGKVREYIRNINGFKSVDIVERDKNSGLAFSIIDGVTTIINKYEKIIVLEDDVEVGEFFLQFMNEALAVFANNREVWHISALGYPVDMTSINDDIFCWRTMDCGWGWGTWANRWQHFEKNTDKLISEFSKSDIKRFNLDGAENFWRQVLLNKKGKINTWAVYWYAVIFKNNGLCVSPRLSYAKNIGFDGMGEHCGDGNPYVNIQMAECPLKSYDIKLSENNNAVALIRQFYGHDNRKIIPRAWRKIKKYYKKIIPPKKKLNG